MKEYKSGDELLEYMITKGIIVKDKKFALDKINMYSYYSIINTYKDVFKGDDGNYINNVSFEEIYALFEFDKNLRSIMLKYTLEIEMILKSCISEIISSKYGIKNYLVRENFDDKLDDEKIFESINAINDEIVKQDGKHEAVTHYMEKYKFIPPFVLVKILTFGQLSRLYGMLKQTDKQSISKKYKISDKALKLIIINMSLVRNICAHNERLYCFYSKFRISFKEIEKNYNKSLPTNFYMIMKSMMILLPSDESNEFKLSIIEEIKKLESKFNSIKINSILNIMGIYKYNLKKNEI